MLTLLIGAGADVNAEADGGTTPLDMARQVGNTVMVEYLSGSRQRQIPLDYELRSIENVVNEHERGIQDGTFSIGSVIQQMRNAPNARTNPAENKEYIATLPILKAFSSLDISRLSMLKRQHPNDLRIRELGSRAAECYLTLTVVWNTAADWLDDWVMQPDSMEIPRIRDPRFQEQINTVETMLSNLELRSQKESLNADLSQIEAVVNECEQMIADGKINADALVKQIQSVTDPQAMIAKGGEVIALLMGQIKKINIVQLKELRSKHPNDSRVRQVVGKAAQCLLKLNNIYFDVNERFGSPDVQAQTQSQNNETRKMLEMMVSDLV
jgi:hypothetical protein